MNWRSKRQVLFLILAACLLMAAGGMAAAWHNRNNTTCADRKPPVSSHAGVLGQIEYVCHDGQVVTTPG